MRLRVKVLRHALPPREILWSVSEDKAKATISQLLEEITHVIPLESDDWGLDDYVVQLEGYDCLHFAQICDVLKDNDRVCIRPLQTAEIRARTLAGCYQISGDGRHLIDGIPFGRPYLRTPNRPTLYIPPRKKRRTTTEDEDIDDLVPKALTYQDTNSRAHPGDDDGQLQAQAGRRSKGRRVSFGGVAEEVDSQALMAFEDDDEDDESGDLNDPGSDELEAADEDDDEDDSDSDSDFDTESEGDEESENSLEDDGVPHQQDKNAILNNSTNDQPNGADLSDSSSSSSESEDSESDSGSEDEDGENLPPEERSSAQEKEHLAEHDARMSEHEARLKEQEMLEDATGRRVTHEKTRTKPSIPPGTGKPGTKARNERKRLQIKLRALKKDGLLPPTAGFEEVRHYYAAKEVQDEEHHDNDIAAPANEVLVEQAAESLEKDDSMALVTTVESKKSSDTTGTLVGDSTALANGENQITDQEEDPFSRLKQLLQEKSKEISASEDIDITQASVDTQVMDSTRNDEVEPASKRARLDMAASKRHIFSALGVRAPKSKAEEEKVKQKLAGDDKRKDVAANIPKAPQPQAPRAPEDPALWRTKVTLSAVECLDEGVTLSAPPFPFKQRWHQQQRDDYQDIRQTQQQKRSASAHKKKKRSTGFDFGLYIPQFAHNDEVEEESYHTMFDTNGGALALEDACDPDDDDLLTLPIDPTTLPIFAASDAKPQTVIAFKQLEVNAATGWVPALSDWRTAIIEEASDGGHTLHVTLAKRDRPERRSRRYDEEGKRLYDGFEMPGFESEGDDKAEDEKGGKVILSRHELSEARIVRAARDDGSTEGVNAVHADGVNGVSPDPFIESETLREAFNEGDDTQQV